MFEYTKEDLNIKAKNLNFTRDTLEKVIRLIKILDFINSDISLKNKLVLKGGTAINLFVFNLPRLSVDIDLDFSGNFNRDEMIFQREEITKNLKLYFETEDYTLSPKTKSRHSLDSFVINYINAGGVNDNIKIEINYSLRNHLFEPEYKKVILPEIESENEIAVLNKYELFAAKINALLSRTMPRDLFDVNNVVNQKVFSFEELDLLRSCFAFYTALSQETIPAEYNLDVVDQITIKDSKAALLPVLKKGTFIELEEYKQNVKPFISEVIKLNDSQKQFLSNFKNGIYSSELLFNDEKIIERIKNHPMIVWKLTEDKEKSKPVSNSEIKN